MRVLLWILAIIAAMRITPILCKWVEPLGTRSGTRLGRWLANHLS